ncbi:MAG: serine hydroxymethyltransferase [Anaerolineaceae bacterium]|nr:serine hydroxymethyltransferase [Anaerolineaceae bacterium]MBN2678493.1 serine hydroxymethyltransferase [Anaerolineaceae bacterium]
MTDFLFRGSLVDLDPALDELTRLESERQRRKLILIPSESAAPMAVREALSSSFQNIYAEGYPDEETRRMSEAEILDYPERLATFRRYSDPRYYKGVEYADTVEALARRRCAEAFAANGKRADQLFVNVQPLSGAPANNAVYTALLDPGDTILGMNLLHGGHLSHGSSVNRSGKLFNAVHYNIDPVTEQIDYEALASLAQEKQPKILIAGYSSYPWVPDWKRFREIADTIGAILLADVSHIAGLIAAGVIPSPIGIAQVTTFTTHKTLCGPRGACIITDDPALAKKLDRAVFPGEQGGPHVHAFAALALTFMLAQTKQFKELQAQIVKNCVTLTDALKAEGFRIPFGGTDTHLTNLDCRTIAGPDGTTLSGDMAARILDIAGLVTNRNTIPGDRTASNASGVRLGTSWVTQRGLKEADMKTIAGVIAGLLKTAVPFSVDTRQGPARRAKVDFDTLEKAKLSVRTLAEKAGSDEETQNHGYPHFFYIDDQPATKGEWVSYDLCSPKLVQALHYIFSSDISTLKPGKNQASLLITSQGKLECGLTCVDNDHYRVTVPSAKAGLAAAWLRDLSDGYTSFDDDPTRRIPGPMTVQESVEEASKPPDGEAIDPLKPYYIGIDKGKGQPLPPFKWEEKEIPLRKTALNETHRKLGAKMVPFACWDMPVWYSSVVEEHLACRQAAGLFDVAHMGVYQAEGPNAVIFLDSVCGNDIGGLGVGESCYTQFLLPDASVIDDCLVYRRAEDKYLVVVNASNDEKDWAWLNAVREGKVMIDHERPWVKAFGREVVLRNLRDPKAGADMRVDIALQGPKSRDILLALGCDAPTKTRIMTLKRTELCDAVVGGFDLIVSRTGYTGEKMAFELFIHPDQAVALWQALMEKGSPLGMKACGLGARDSLRTEAGLPLYGHEMAGNLNLGVAEGGFGSYVKIYKPWFIGRKAFIEREKTRTQVVARFRFTEKGVRMAHNGDPVVDKKGKVIGVVTSCAVDSEGFLTGQALVTLPIDVEGTPIAIFQSAAKEPGKAPAGLILGDRVNLPTPAVIVSRFPKR